MKAYRNLPADIVHLAYDSVDSSLCGMMANIDSRIGAGTCMDISLGRSLQYLRQITTCAKCVNISKEIAQ